MQNDINIKNRQSILRLRILGRIHRRHHAHRHRNKIPSGPGKPGLVDSLLLLPQRRTDGSKACTSPNTNWAPTTTTSSVANVNSCYKRKNLSNSNAKPRNRDSPSSPSASSSTRKALPNSASPSPGERKNTTNGKPSNRKTPNGKWTGYMKK